MDFGTNPLTTTSLGAVILLMAIAIKMMWNEIRHLNRERLKDIKEIGEEDRKVVKKLTVALISLRRKIDGINGGKHD